MSASPPSYASLPFSTMLELMTKLDEHVQPQHPTWFSIKCAHCSSILRVPG